MKTLFRMFSLAFLFFPVFTFATALDPHITVDTFSSGSATISWDSVSGADRYLLDYGTNSGGPYSNGYDGPNATVSFVGLDLNTDYYFVLSVADSSGSVFATTSEHTFRINSSSGTSPYTTNNVEGSDFGDLAKEQIESDAIETPSFLGDFTPQQALSALVNALMGISASIATMALIWGGILRATAVGDEEKIETSKKFFFWSIIGFVICFSAWGIVALVQGFIPASS